MRRIINGASIDVGPRKPKKRKPPRAYVVYAFGDVEARYIKFGHAYDHRKRLNSLQVGSPLELRILGTCAASGRWDAFQLEALIHEAAVEHFIRGEWFRSCPRTLLIIGWMSLGRDRFWELVEPMAERNRRYATKVDGPGISSRSLEAKP